MSLSNTQKATLKTELTNDPQTLGYQALLDVGNDSGLADLLNAVHAGGDFQVPREPVTSTVINRAITLDDFLAMAPTDFQRLNFLLTSQPSIDLSDAVMLAKVLACLPADGPSRTAVNSLQTRQGTRAEVVLAVNGIRLTSADIAAARNYSP